MEAKDLRIGNYIERHNKVTGVKDIIQVDGGTPLFAFEGMTTIEFNPIPLTEEWLLKFGFNDCEKGDISYYIENNGEIVFKKSGLDILYDYPIQYVHQLQNLYYVLTGDELIFEQYAIKSDNTEAKKTELFLEALKNTKDYLGSDVRNELESIIQKYKK